MLVLIDNYDSFVHTLARYCRELGAATRIVRNDAVGLADLSDATAVLLSPGPCGPAESGICRDVVRSLDKPILGVCLGHQAIVDACGGRVEPSGQPQHGRASLIRHDGSSLFAGLPPTLAVARYHSLVATDVPGDLAVTATLADDGQPPHPMAVQHRERPIFGVQFHPESVLTPCGRRLLRNFLDRAGFDGLTPADDLVDETFTAVDAGLPDSRHRAGDQSGHQSESRRAAESQADPADFYARPSQLAYPLPPGID